MPVNMEMNGFDKKLLIITGFGEPHFYSNGSRFEIPKGLDIPDQGNALGLRHNPVKP